MLLVELATPITVTTFRAELFNGRRDKWDIPIIVKCAWGDDEVFLLEQEVQTLQALAERMRTSSPSPRFQIPTVIGSFIRDSQPKANYSRMILVMEDHGHPLKSSEDKIVSICANGNELVSFEPGTWDSPFYSFGQDFMDARA